MGQVNLLIMFKYTNCPFNKRALLVLLDISLFITEIVSFMSLATLAAWLWE